MSQYSIPTLPQWKPQYNVMPEMAGKIRKNFDPNFDPSQRSPTFGEEASLFLQNRKAQPLLQRQYDETRAAQDASLQGRQKAIDALVQREGAFNQDYLNPAMAGIRNDPFTDFLKRNIQSVVSNPNPLSADQISQMEAANRDSTIGLLDAEIKGLNDSFSARGLSGSGINAAARLDATERAGSDITKQSIGLNRDNAFKGSDNRLAALQTGSGLTDSLNAAINQLLGIGAGYNSDIGNQISQLLATQYQAPDYSGLINAGLANRESSAARNKGGFFNSALGQILGGAAGMGFGGLMGSIR